MEEYINYLISKKCVVNDNVIVQKTNENELLISYKYKDVYEKAGGYDFVVHYIVNQEKNIIMLEVQNLNKRFPKKACEFYLKNMGVLEPGLELKTAEEIDGKVNIRIVKNIKLDDSGFDKVELYRTTELVIIRLSRQLKMIERSVDMFT